MTTAKQFRRKFKGKATFRVAPGSDSPYSAAVSRLVVTTNSERVYKKLKSMENKLQEIFEVEIVIFR